MTYSIYNEGKEEETTMFNYSKMTQEDFDRILCDLLRGMNGVQLLAVPGVAEILIEEFNNEVLERWASEQVEKED